MERTDLLRNNSKWTWADPDILFRRNRTRNRRSTNAITVLLSLSLRPTLNDEQMQLTSNWLQKILKRYYGIICLSLFFLLIIQCSLLIISVSIKFETDSCGDYAALSLSDFVSPWKPLFGRRMNAFWAIGFFYLSADKMELLIYSQIYIETILRATKDDTRYDVALI